MRASGDLENTQIVLMGDHGLSFGEKFAPPDTERGFRTHSIYLDTVLGLSDCGKKPTKETVLDSSGVSATLFDVLGVSLREGSPGISAFDGGAPFVISETAGRGSCDLENKVLYFTITAQDYKLFTAVDGSNLEIRKINRLSFLF